MTSIMSRFLKRMALQCRVQVPQTRTKPKRQAALSTEHLESRDMLSVSFAGTEYTQNFDSLSSLPAGWLANKTSGTGNAPYTGSLGASISPTNYNNNNSGGFYYYGNPERALGSTGSNSFGGAVYGVNLTNDTGSDLSTITISLDYEMWRRGSNATPNVVTLGYRLGGGDDLSGPYDNIPSLNSSFTSGSTGSPGATQSLTDVQFTLPSPWTAGSLLSLRWDDPNNPSTDDAIALDNFVFSASSGDQAPSISTPFNTTVNEGETGFFQVMASGNPTPNSFTLSNNPAWVQIDSGSGFVTFDPTGTNGRVAVDMATPYTFDVTVSNGVAPDATQTFTVTDLPALVSYGSVGGTYSQNFDALFAPTSETSLLNLANVTLPTNPTVLANAPYLNETPPGTASPLEGWQYASIGGTTQRFTASAGSTNSGGGTYDFGPAGDTDRALGGFSSSTGVGRFGIALLNTTTEVLSQFTLNFTEEQWFRGNSSDVIAFSYGVASNLNDDPSLIPFPSFDLTTVNPGASTGANDGNDPLNQAAKSGTVTGISWAPGQVLYLRWSDTTTGGTQDGLAIDNLTFSASDSPNAAPSITSANSATILEGTADSFQVIATGLPSTFTYSLTGAPSWVSIDTNGLLSFDTVGRANITEGTASTFTITVSNGIAPDAMQTFTVTDVPGAAEYDSGTYTQNFDRLFTPANTSTTLLTQVGITPPTTPVVLANAPFLNTTPPSGASLIDGWQFSTVAGSTQRFITSAGNTSSGAGAYGFGATSDTDRALGATASGTNASQFGVALINTSLTTYTEFTLGFTVEQWSRGNTGLDLLAFSYAVGATSLNDDLFFTPFSNLDAATVNAGAASGPLDGNSAENRLLKNGTVTGISWAPGQTLYLRWTDSDSSGTDDGLAIDDLSFTTEPPVVAPGTFSINSSFGLIAENGGASTLTITRSAGSSGAVDVSYTITGNADPSDYTADSVLSGTLSFADGETVKQITITGVDDGDHEGDETLTVTLTAATNGGLIGAPVETTVTIVDDDPAQAQYFALSGGAFSQDWSDINQITVNDDWSGVISLRGFSTTLGAPGSDPQLNLSPSLILDVNANQTNPLAFNTGGVTEFELADPTIAIYGSGSAPSPNLVAYLDTTGQTGVQVSYRLRDLEAGTDDAIQPVALQYRIGSIGDFIDIPEAFVPDATTPGFGPDIFKSITLPAAADNQSKIELRWITINAAGNDEAVGIDDIVVSTGSGGTAGSLGFDPVMVGDFEGSGTINLTLRRTGGSTGAVSADYAVTAGTATGGGTDYTLAAGTVSWADGDMADKFVPILLINDGLNEADETIVVSLSNPTGQATLTPGADVATATIFDDDQLTADEFIVNGGDPQRSRVTRVQLTFNGDVTLSPSNFQLTNTTTGMLFTGSIGVLPQTVNGQTVATLSFSGTGTEFGSLEDGRYTLTVTGVSGLTGPNSFDFFRLFGDINGDGTVDGPNDFAQFGGVFGTTTVGNPFDFNDDGTIDGSTDFAQFGGRFGRTI